MYNKLTLEASTDFALKCFNDYTVEEGVPMDIPVKAMFKEPITQQDYPFTLKTGYADASGASQKEGVLRPPTLRDELAAVKLPEKKPEQDKMGGAGWAKGYGNYEVLDGSSRDRGGGPVFDPDKVIARVVTKLGNLGKLEYSQLRGLTAEDRKIIRETYKQAKKAPDVTWMCPGKPPEAEGQDPIPEQERTLNFEDLMKRYGYVQ